MGCVSSKDHQKVCQKCQAPCSRMYSSRSKPDSINLNEEEEQKKKMNEVIMDFPMATAVIEAKNWSEMIEKKIPKILSKTTMQDMSSITPQPPAGEEEEAPETINTWELMEGLEEEEEETTGESSSPENDSSSASEIIYDSNSNSSTSVISTSSELDKEEISSFRKELEELNPANPFHLNPLTLVCTEEEEEETNRVRERVVLYFTSLRGVRKTYKECCYVRVTLRELGFLVDERDVSMHSGFKGELKELLLLREEVGGFGFGFGFGLPRVFVGNKYIGGAEEIRHLHEEGELEKALEGCERLISGSRRRICQGCGDIGFVPCQTCCGSCKIFYQHEHEHEDFYYQNEEEENEICDESEYGFQRCPDCNENGLIRCPICC